MKTIFIVRHAKSSWKYPRLDDFERPLNKRGYRDAPLMGRRLKKRQVMPERIFASPAVRAAMTARIIAAALGYPLRDICYSEALYDFSESSLLQVVRQMDDTISKAMIVGHNPAVTALANHVGDQVVSNLPTAAVYAVATAVSRWADIDAQCGKVVFFDFPKKQTGG